MKSLNSVDGKLYTNTERINSLIINNFKQVTLYYIVLD